MTDEWLGRNRPGRPKCGRGKAVETVVLCDRRPPVSPPAPKLPVRPLVGAAVPRASLPSQRVAPSRQRYHVFLQSPPYFSAKPHEMTSVRTSPGSQSSILRAGAHRNGLRDVEEARTSPLHYPESHWLAAPVSQILQKKPVGIHPYSSARNTILQKNPVDSIIFRQKHNSFLIRRKMWSDTFSRPSRAPTPPNLSVVNKNRNVSRIG
jgi:hypothetical protein